MKLRLDPPELAAFQRSGYLETVVPLGLHAGAHLTYALERSLVAAEVQVEAEPGRIRVLLPAATADAWTSTDEVSLRGKIAAFNNQVLHILVEKDLGCKH